MPIPTANKRTHDLYRWIHNLIKKNQGKTKEQIVALSCIQFGLNEKTAQEKIEHLILTGVVEAKDGGLHANEGFN